MGNEPKSDRFWWIWLALVCAYAFVHSAGYALSNPVFESPDEPGHLAYINRIAAGRGLPDQYDPWQFTPEGHQHALYYVTLGAVIDLAGGPISVTLPRNPRGGLNPQFDHTKRPFGSSRDRILFLALRLLGALMAGGTALYVGLAARKLLPIGHVWLLAPMVAAGLPELAFISGSISNDGLVALFGAATTYAAISCIVEPQERRKWIAFGICFGLLLLTKKSALIFVPAILVLVGALKLSGTPGRKLAMNSGAAMLLALLIFSPILIRNLILYHEPLGNRMEMATLPDLVFAQWLGSRHFRVHFPDIVPRSFVAHFGWMNVEVKQQYVWPFVRLLFAGMTLSLIGLMDKRLRVPLIFCWTVILSNVIGLVYYNLIFPQAQGRLLFPSLAAVCLLCAIGVHELSRRIPLPHKSWGLVPVAIALLWFDYLAILTNQNFYTGPPW